MTKFIRRKNKIYFLIVLFNFVFFIINPALIAQGSGASKSKNFSDAEVLAIQKAITKHFPFLKELIKTKLIALKADKIQQRGLRIIEGSLNSGTIYLELASGIKDSYGTSDRVFVQEIVHIKFTGDKIQEIKFITKKSKLHILTNMIITYFDNSAVNENNFNDLKLTEEIKVGEHVVSTATYLLKEVNNDDVEKDFVLRYRYRLKKLEMRILSLKSRGSINKIDDIRRILKSGGN